MRPAFSVIFLTTLIGLGQGLFLSLYATQVYTSFGLTEITVNEYKAFYGVGSFVVLGLLGSGLFASFFHLGHPGRAWRAVVQWRTSWLSREVIVIPLLMMSVFCYGLIHYFGGDFIFFKSDDSEVFSLTLLVGAISVFIVFALFHCTAMIYASINFLKEWSSPLTEVNFILLGCASGFTLATLFASLTAPDLVNYISNWAVLLISTAFFARVISLLRNHNLRIRQSAKYAIGINCLTIRYITQSINARALHTSEYRHGQSKLMLDAMKWGFLLFTFFAPLLLLLIFMQDYSVPYLVAAVILQYLGLLSERLYFFAEVNHPQNSFYSEEIPPC